MKLTWSRRVLEIAGTTGLAALLSASAIGCKSSEPEIVDPPEPPIVETQPLTSVAPVAESSEFWAPLDASPSPDGEIIYFTAMAEAGPAVFKVVPGGTAEILSTGDVLSSPFSVIPSFDGSKLYIVDSGAENEDDMTGRIFSMSSSGGEPTPLTAADGTTPKSLTVVQVDGNDVIYFTGVDTESESPAVMRMNADGTNLEVVLSGDPLVDPSGIAVTTDGRIYVVDSEAGANGTAALLLVSASGAEEVVRDLRVGYPAGMALDFNETALFVSGLAKNDPSAVVYHIVLATKVVTEINDGIAQNSESAGVHRAHKADVYAWANADGSADDPAGGTVYLLKGPGAQ